MAFPIPNLVNFSSYSLRTFQLLTHLSIANVAILTATKPHCSKDEFEFILNIEA